MLLELDDLPVHQTPASLAHVQAGHPNAYDRFWFNGYREDLFFCVAFGMYPNRGVVDAAVGTVRAGVQRSVFASGRLAGRTTALGPIAIELVEPMRVATVRIDAAEHGLRGELTFIARSAACEERQTRHVGPRLLLDMTRATQLGSWQGWLEVDGERIELAEPATFGTKDRSWGVRPVGEPTPAAPEAADPQLYFLWSPLNFDDVGLHVSIFEDAAGLAWAKTAATLDLLGEADSPVEPSLVRPMRAATPSVGFARGRRYAEHATLAVTESDGASSVVELEPVLTFRMRGAGYFHPTFAHGRWHGELVVAGESHPVDELDTTSFHDVHVEQVVRARWGDRTGIGVLELLVIGPHAPSGLTGLTDGAP